MTRTTSGWLSELTSFYTPSSSQFDAARAHRQSIEIRLNSFLGLHEMFEIGSLRHGTAVWLYSDADYLASLKGIRPDSPWTMLNRVKDTLKDRFPSTNVVVRRPAVVCRFANANVEVVPGYSGSSGGYWIADPSDGWMLTYPKAHNAYVNTVNSAHNGAVKKLARQVKVWKYKQSVPISSCYLEMRSAKHMDGEKAYLPLWDLYLSLSKMLDSGLAAMNDPTGLGSRFGACSSTSSRQDALSKLRTAVGRASKAKEYEAADNHEGAIGQLKLLFDW